MNDWFANHWQELIASICLGGGTSVLGTKMIDKQQNKRIDKIEGRLTSIESDLTLNNGLDNQFRKELDNRLGNIESLNNRILEHLLNKK